MVERESMQPAESIQDELAYGLLVPLHHMVNPWFLSMMKSLQKGTIRSQ